MSGRGRTAKNVPFPIQSPLDDFTRLASICVEMS